MKTTSRWFSTMILLAGCAGAEPHAGLAPRTAPARPAPTTEASKVEQAPASPPVADEPRPSEDAAAVDSRLPALTFERSVAYGGSVTDTLEGAEPRACATAPPVAKSKPTELWAAAQCAVVRGEATASALAQVRARCAGLARQALPLVRALAALDRKARDGADVSEERREALAARVQAVMPPSACFAEAPLWADDYTGRNSAFVLPKVTLAEGWSDGLEALVSARVAK